MAAGVASTREGTWRAREMNIQTLAEKTPQNVKRLGWWYLAITVGLVVVGLVASQQLAVLAFKVSQVCIGVLLAYIADRTLFRHAPDIAEDMAPDALSGARLLARAIVALAVIVGVTIGI